MSEENTEQPRRRSIHDYLLEDIATTNADYLLLFVTLGVGCIDAFSFTELKVFAANMTGNTVFLALAAAQVNDSFLSAPRSIVALTSFWVGSFVSGQLGHRIGTKVRWWVCFAFFWQGLLVLTAAIILWTGGVTGEDVAALDLKVLSIVCLLSLSYGAQATTARGLTIPEIPTVVVTSAMVDLFGDKNLFVLHNRPRNRRAGFVVSLFIGAFIGGWVFNKVNSALTVAISAVFKFLSAVFVLFYPPAKVDRQRVQHSQAGDARKS